LARDGSGTYTRVEGPYVNGVVADADEMNNELDDIADAITDSINISGTKAMAANWSMGGFRLTDLAAPSSANDAARKAYVDSAITAASQPLDATLTALAALSWSSGNALVQFTAADTVSLTLTPSVKSVTATETTLSSNPLIGKNTADSATVRALRLEGDRATPAANDAVIASFYLSDSAGNQDEMVRLAATATAVTSGAEAARLDIYTISAGSLAARAFVSAAAVGPISNDGIALGTATLSFSDLFLASGAVINFNNGNFTLTHSSGLLSASGAIQARVPLSSETSGTLTTASQNKKVICSGNITIPNSVFTADDFVLFDPGTSNRTFTRSSTNMYVNGTDSASATLGANQIGACHFRSATAAVLSGAFS